MANDSAPADDLHIGHLLRRAYRTHMRAVSASLEPAGMTSQSFFVLIALDKQDGLDQTALSKELHLEKAALTATLRQLIEDGYIRRSSHGTDGRKLLVFMTKKGRAFTAANLAKIVAI